MSKTKQIQMTRGQTYIFTETVRDPVTRQPVDLTGAKIHWLLSADAKVAPIVRLTSEDPVPDDWRGGVVIQPQTGATKGQYTVTIVPADTSALVALGHDDPYLHMSWVEESGGATYPDIETSVLDLYPQVGDVP